MKRRRFLAGTTAVAGVLVAGCGSPDDGDDGGGGIYDLGEPDAPADRNDDPVQRRDGPSDRSSGADPDSDPN